MTVVDCTLRKPICNKTFDYNKFDANRDVPMFLGKSESVWCECYTSPYTDQDHKYVELKHFAYGQKYQETLSVILFTVKKCLKVLLDEAARNGTIIYKKQHINSSYVEI